MSRAAWFVAGAGVGVYAVTRARRAAEVLTPEGLADRLAGLSVGLRLLREEVRVGAAEKETELRERLSMPPPGSRAELSEGHAATATPRSDNSATDARTQTKGSSH